MTAGRTLLGFDYGTRKIGVAVGQELTGSSTPVATLRTPDGEPDWTGIAALIETWRPAALVVGIPLNLDGSEQEMTRAARRFADRLAARHHLPVYHADERLSSVEAEHLRYEDTGGGRSRRRRGVDEIAAHVILQTFFSQQREGEGPGRSPKP
jgi:putative Holliday junction resolvase